MTVQHVILQHILNAPPVTPAPSLHVAIITDGNGRWATSRGLPRSAGHRAGAEASRSIIEAAPKLASTRSRFSPSPQRIGSVRLRKSTGSSASCTNTCSPKLPAALRTASASASSAGAIAFLPRCGRPSQTPKLPRRVAAVSIFVSPSIIPRAKRSISPPAAITRPRNFLSNPFQTSSRKFRAALNRRRSPDSHRWRAATLRFSSMGMCVCRTCFLGQTLAGFYGRRSSRSARGIFSA